METTEKEEVQFHGPAMADWDPWNPPDPPCAPIPPEADLKSRIKLTDEWFDKRNEIFATSRSTNTIIPDRTPESSDDAFYKVLPRLMAILEKDSVRRFLTLFRQVRASLGWGFIITPLAFTQMVKQNALRCAKVALEGKTPELYGFRANPNCMNRHGYFPLHGAAEIFSVDMVKLLFQYGASADLRTAGAEVIEDLLPLHVAVENTCMHKYLEKNALPTLEDLEDRQANLNYVCKLIHLLCLPEMKIFLDTTRLLAENTHNVVDELWNYIKDGKMVQTAVLLLAAQKQIRGESSCEKNGKIKPDGFSVKSPCKKNGNGKPDGFSLIINRIETHTISLLVQMGQNGKKKNKELEVKKKLTFTASLLVRAVYKGGEVLDGYIQSYPEVPHNMLVPHNEVHERVSSILKDCGFCPGESVNVGNLCRYENVLSKKESPNNHGAMFQIEAGCQQSKEETVVKNRTPRGWELKYARRSFFPYWRSVLKAKSPCKIIQLQDNPSPEEVLKSWNKLVYQGSPHQILNPNLDLLARARQSSNYQPKRMFCSAALSMLKVFRHA